MAAMAFPTMLEKLVQIWFTVFPKFTSHAFTVSQFLYSRTRAAATAVMIPSVIPIGLVRNFTAALMAFVATVAALVASVLAFVAAVCAQVAAVVLARISTSFTSSAYK